MSKNEKLDIIKGALLLEHKGKALYESVTETSDVPEVKELFQLLAAEEDQHIKILRKQYSRLIKDQDFDVSELEKSHSGVSDQVAASETVNKIFGAGYEAAVVSAALDFEKRAVEYYSRQAASADSEAQKELYQWLTDWEKTHMEMLAKIDDDIKERIWFDNRFWPLD
jgi:rubrerythrin